MQALVQATMLLDNTPPKKHCGLTKEANLRQTLNIPRFGRVGLNDTILLVNVVCIAIQHIAVWMGLEVLYNFSCRAWVIDIVGIKPTNNRPRGQRDAFINGVRLSLIFFRKPADAVALASQDVDCSILAPAVNDEIFQVASILPKDAVNCPLNEGTLIERRRND
jgi:hypothetical protein